MRAGVLLLAAVVALMNLTLNHAAYIKTGYCREWLKEIEEHNKKKENGEVSDHEEDFSQKHEMLPECDEDGNFVPKQCHVFHKNDTLCEPHGPCYLFKEGEQWCICVHPLTGAVDKESITKGGENLHCDYEMDKQGPCPKYWILYREPDREYCYRFINSNKTWVEAETYCQFEGGHLASIHCEDTNRFLQSLSRGDTFDFPMSWAGATNAVDPCFWFWTDGEFFDYEDFITEKSQQRNNSCLRINTGCNSNKMKWSPGGCNETLPFICAKHPKYKHDYHD